ncbi:unnamed protein product, partial [Heterosigma akashiwo]
YATPFPIRHLQRCTFVHKGVGNVQTRPYSVTQHVRSSSKATRNATGVGNGGGGSNKPSSMFDEFWKWTTQKRPHWKESKTEAAVLFCVFGITGSSSVAFVRPILKDVIGLDGTMKDGPWSYRIGSVLMVSPIYACVLMTVGTLAGRHAYFAASGQKILGRFLPRKVSRELACAPAKAKKARQ